MVIRNIPGTVKCPPVEARMSNPSYPLQPSSHGWGNYSEYRRSKFLRRGARSAVRSFIPSCVQGGSLSCPFVLRYRSMYGPDRPPFDTSGRTVLNATEYQTPNSCLNAMAHLILMGPAKKSCKIGPMHVNRRHPADCPKRMTDEPSGMPSALREVHRQGMPGRAFHQMIAYCC